MQCFAHRDAVCRATARRRLVGGCHRRRGRSCWCGNCLTSAGCSRQHRGLVPGVTGACTCTPLATRWRIVHCRSCWCGHCWTSGNMRPAAPRAGTRHGRYMLCCARLYAVCRTMPMLGMGCCCHRRRRSYEFGLRVLCKLFAASAPCAAQRGVHEHDSAAGWLLLVPLE
jgi:hypothetical protein